VKAKASLGSCAQLTVFFEIVVTAGFSISCLRLQILFLLLWSGLRKGFVFRDSAGLVLVSPVHAQDALKPFFVLPPEIFPSRSCISAARHRVGAQTVLSWRATLVQFFMLDSRRLCRSRSDLRRFLLELLPPFSCFGLHPSVSHGWSVSLLSVPHEGRVPFAVTVSRAFCSVRILLATCRLSRVPF
jgi:hypothetical protein